MAVIEREGPATAVIGGGHNPGRSTMVIAKELATAKPGRQASALLPWFPTAVAAPPGRSPIPVLATLICKQQEGGLSPLGGMAGDLERPDREERATDGIPISDGMVEHIRDICTQNEAAFLL